MTRIDLSATGIAIGVVGALVYTALCTLRRKSFDVGQTILVFLALFSLPSGVALIRAGILGESAALPGTWREHVAVAGIAIIGLALQHIVAVFRSAFIRTVARAGEANEDAPIKRASNQTII